MTAPFSTCIACGEPLRAVGAMRVGVGPFYANVCGGCANAAHRLAAVLGRFFT